MFNSNQNKATDTTLADFRNPQLIKRKISEFKGSEKRRRMFEAERYYEGRHDILKRKREVIGSDGKLKPVENLPNNRKIDNQYRKMVVQKTNYLLGKPVTFQTKTAEHAETLQDVFNRRFVRLLKNVGRNAINSGIGFIYPHYDEVGNFCFKRFEPTEFIPIWQDADHTRMAYGIRFFPLIIYEGENEREVESVEVYTPEGVFFYVNDSDIVPAKIPFQPYIIASTGEMQEAFNWLQIPVIPFKYNHDEQSLLSISVKSLQDGINTMLSNFQNNMEEDPRNTIMVIVNYDGEKPGEFRQNLSQYGVVKVRNDREEPGGDVKTLTVEVNAENYKAILELFKKALIENAMGYDAKSDRTDRNVNQMNIQSMYSDIEMDANEMELEFQASFELLLWFVHNHLANIGIGDWQDESVEVIFNRDMMMNEAEVIANVAKSVGILSDETVIANHPWTNNIIKELTLKQQEETARINQEMGTYNEAFGRDVDE